jgi:putative endonuclease
MEKTKTWNQAIGRKGESYAERFFLERRYLILNKNYRTPYGEIDLVVEKDGEISFIEVKTRTGNEFGYGESAVNSKKLEHLVASAEHYMGVETVDTENWHIDVLAIQILEHNTPEYAWFENVT